MMKLKKSENVSVIFMQLGLLFTVCLIAANIFETKEQDTNHSIFDVFRRGVQQ